MKNLISPFIAVLGLLLALSGAICAVEQGPLFSPRESQAIQEQVALENQQHLVDAELDAQEAILDRLVKGQQPTAKEKQDLEDAKAARKANKEKLPKPKAK
jgi:hypothetical protein